MDGIFKGYDMNTQYYTGKANVVVVLPSRKSVSMGSLGYWRTIRHPLSREIQALEI